MLIILGLYCALAWLVFSKLKLVKWDWVSGTVTVAIGALILAIFVAMLRGCVNTEGGVRVRASVRSDGRL